MCFTKKFPLGYSEEKPTRIPHLLNWRVIHEKMAWNVLFLLGGSVALATACKVQHYVQTCKYSVFRWYNHGPVSLKKNFSSPEPNAVAHLHERARPV